MDHPLWWALLDATEPPHLDGERRLRPLRRHAQRSPARYASLHTAAACCCLRVCCCCGSCCCDSFCEALIRRSHRRLRRRFCPPDDRGGAARPCCRFPGHRLQHWTHLCSCDSREVRTKIALRGREGERGGAGGREQGARRRAAAVGLSFSVAHSGFRRCQSFTLQTAPPPRSKRAGCGRLASSAPRSAKIGPIAVS